MEKGGGECENGRKERKYPIANTQYPIMNERQERNGKGWCCLATYLNK
jgi:hypothetical protein